MKYNFDVSCVTFAVCGNSKGRSFRCCRAKLWQRRRSACELEVPECPGHVWIKRGRPGSRTLSSSPLLLHRRLWIAAQGAGAARCAKGQHQERRTEHNQRLTEAKRKATGLNQTELGKKLGWSQQKVSEYEDGKRRIDVVQFIQFCEVLDEDPLEMLAEVLRRLICLRMCEYG
jgi:hypothetical protein